MLHVAIWKAEIKNKIANYLELTEQNEKRHKTRFLINDNLTKKKYLTELEAKKVYDIINLTLNIINVKDN